MNRSQVVKLGFGDRQHRHLNADEVFGEVAAELAWKGLRGGELMFEVCVFGAGCGLGDLFHVCVVCLVMASRLELLQQRRERERCGGGANGRLKA